MAWWQASYVAQSLPVKSYQQLTFARGLARAAVSPSPSAALINFICSCFSVGSRVCLVCLGEAGHGDSVATLLRPTLSYATLY